MKLTVVYDDKTINKDGVVAYFDDGREATLDELIESQGHTGVHAIQWDETSGHIEYKDGRVIDIDAQAFVNAYVSAFDAEKLREKNALKEFLMTRDAEIEARAQRNMLLDQTDWYGMSDVVMPQEIADYRQALRDLPETNNWNPSWQWDDEKEDTILVGVTFPVKP